MPYGITNDEAGYIYNAYSISQTGRDVNGRFLPLSINLDNPFSPVPIYLNAIFLRILGLSVFTGRFFYALLGTGSILLIYLIAKILFKDYRVGLISSFVLAISPWHLHVSRSAYEAGVALFFFLLAFLIFLIKTEKGNINWSLPFFLLAFYSYHGTKIFFIPFIVILALNYKEILIRRKREFILFIVGIGFIILSFLYLGKKQNAFGRSQIFLIYDVQNAAKLVDLERQKNTAPFIVRQIFNNKLLYFLRVIRENYLNAFSPGYLFLYGETSGMGSVYGTFFRGEMYVLDLPFLIFGIFILEGKYKKLRNTIFLSLLAAPLTTTFTSDVAYVMRAIMMLPFLCLLVGLGVFSFIKAIEKYSLVVRKAILIILFGWYLFLLASYLYQYHFRYSVYGAESWFRSSRELSDFIMQKKNEYNKIYIASAGSMFILQYGVFAKVEPEKISHAWTDQSFKELENISFLKECIDNKKSPLEFLPDHTLYIVPDGCHKSASPSSVIKDFGEPLRTIWKIYSKE